LDVVARSFTMVLYFVVDITIRIYTQNKGKRKQEEEEEGVVVI
jgi:hypothetical protein